MAKRSQILYETLINLRLNQFGKFTSKELECYLTILSSPEPTAKVKFPDLTLAAVRRHCRRCSCFKIFIFSSFSPEPLGLFQLNLTQSILG